MEFQQIKPQKIYERVAEQLKEMIINGDLKPGERLLSVRELAEQLQVGRSAVREALTALNAMGLVEIRQGEGTFVKKYTESDLVSFDIFTLLLDFEQIQSLLEIRKILEVSAAELAAERRTNEDLFHLEQALKKMEVDLSNLDANEEADWMFHYALSKATKNNMLVYIIENISDAIKKSLRTSRKVLFSMPKTPERLLTEHQNIYQAVEQKDAELAASLMFQHLKQVENTLTKVSKEKGQK
ncbi:FadR/GntR family transcriptional regulator [Tepidibacillus infernus]|uniref:FadR/GntR family transcriptional regulator n=1 Tax=Tepidibacillus TaxID=1494427 RepID=UPI0008530216|nr:FadR/GntR family transcriptional regulator [Tepidibacillus sp. HK-1]GBF12489.1 HTH-type transcriptional regulator LutR [Tepidibacillus sp. HK-1]